VGGGFRGKGLDFAFSIPANGYWSTDFKDRGIASVKTKEAWQSSSFKKTKNRNSSANTVLNPLRVENQDCFVASLLAMTVGELSLRGFCGAETVAISPLCHCEGSP